MSTQIIGNNAFVDWRVIRKKSCKLLAIVGIHSGAADKYLHIHEADSEANLNDAIPIFCFPVHAGLPFSFALPIPDGVDMDKCTAIFSTTAEHTTIIESGDASIVGIVKA